jgi:hypothetical protein
MASIRIALAQINSTVGDLAGNAARIAGFAARARAAGAQLMVTPELALCGYPPEDLLLRPDFYRACARSSRELARRDRGHRRRRRPSRGAPRRLLQRRLAAARRPRRRHLPQASPAQLRGVRRAALFRRRLRALRGRGEWRALRHQHLRRRLGAGRGRCRARAGAELLLASTPRPTT